MDSDVKWIRIFDITDTDKHRKGFIIYKVISMLYPEKCPEAITRLTVWKRYNDFKKLHREMKTLHGKYNLPGSYPTLSRGTFFKKYDKQALIEKKQSALNFLEYIGSHYQLFTSKEFVEFFGTSYYPQDHLNGNINSIRAGLNLPDDQEYLGALDDQMISDTDSISTLSSISPSTDHLNISVTSSLSGISTEVSQKSINAGTSRSSNVGTLSIDSLTLLDGQTYNSPPRSPDNDDVFVQYIIDASVHTKIAEELENCKKYEQSFVAYMTAIDILLKHGTNEKNYDRKRLVKYETEKYLVRAEKLYNMYLAPEVKDLQILLGKTEKTHEVPRPKMSDLYKYNVVRIIDSGMLVIHSDSQNMFYVKVVHKTTKFLDDNLILPENVPFMVKLYNYYNCDNALFLILEYVNGLKLSEHLKKIKTNSAEKEIMDDIFHTGDNAEISDDDSENSFKDLVNDYAERKMNQHEDSDDSFEKITKEDLPVSYTKNIIDQPIPKKISTKLKGFFTGESQGMVLSTNESRRKSSAMPSFEAEMEQNIEIPYRDIVKWAAQLILALEKLHILGITCKDLRSRNLLIDEKGDLKLTFMCNVKELCDVFNNTRDLNLAPEVRGISPVGLEADWWSLGAILYEMLVGMELNNVHPGYFCSSTLLKVPKYVSPEGRSLLRQLLVYEPKDRLGSGCRGIDNLKSHPFFKGVNWNEFLNTSEN